jgi:hypothetical protein
MTAAPRLAKPSRSGVWACEKGAELIEFALIFPTLLLVILGIMDFGFLFQRYEVVTNAAREGARIAILPGYDGANIQANAQARVNQYLVAGGLPGTATVNVGAVQTIDIGGQCINVRPVTVAYNHNFLFLGPILGLMGGTGLSNKTLHATSAMRSEIASTACP